MACFTRKSSGVATDYFVFSVAVGGKITMTWSYAPAGAMGFGWRLLNAQGTLIVGEYGASPAATSGSMSWIVPAGSYTIDLNLAATQLVQIGHNQSIRKVNLSGSFAVSGACSSVAPKPPPKPAPPPPPKPKPPAPKPPAPAPAPKPAPAPAAGPAPVAVAAPAKSLLVPVVVGGAVVVGAVLLVHTGKSPRAGIPTRGVGVRPPGQARRRRRRR